jgi:putative transcription factor
MCGSNASLFLTKVEGTSLKLCEKCSKYGVVQKKIQDPLEIAKKKETKLPLKKTTPQVEEGVVSNYSEVIKNAREKKGLKQEELAKKINEKESLLHKIESGHMEPPILLARKLEHFLGIKIVEEVKFQDYANVSPKAAYDTLTLGDVIKIKKR